MSLLFRKFYNLVLNRRTVSWSRSLYDACVDRGSVQIVPNDIMSPLIGISQPAGYLLLLHGLWIRGKGKGNHLLVSSLLLHLGIIYAASVHSGRSSRLEPPQLYSHFLKRIRQICSRLQPVWPRISDRLPAKASCPQISPRTQNHGPAFIDPSRKRFHARYFLFSASMASIAYF